jgi:DNA polymerase III epsilon subunit family exonuclease
MTFRRNLVSDSILVQETVEMLRLCGGRAPAIEVVDLVLKIPKADVELATSLIADLVKDDHRIRVLDGSIIELTSDDGESRLLSESDFVVFDLETTGPKTPSSRIAEIGAYRITNGRIAAEFQTLVNPQVPIPPFVARLTGITDEMVRDAPLFSQIAHAWLEFIGDAILVAHDSARDVAFLNYEVSCVFPGLRMNNSQLCTVKLLRSVFPDLANYRLHTVADYFDIPLVNHHRAASDARATAEVFILILNRLNETGVRDLGTARSLKWKHRR